MKERIHLKKMGSFFMSFLQRQILSMYTNILCIKKKGDMQMSTKKYSKVLVKAIRDFLDKDGWKYSFDKEYGVFLFSLSIDSVIDRIDYYVFVHEKHYVVRTSFPVEADVEDPEMMSRLAEFICRANRNLVAGNFQLDYVDGMITYKNYVDCDGCVPPETIIAHSIRKIATVYDVYGPGILNVMDGKKSPKDAVTECEK